MRFRYFYLIIALTTFSQLYSQTTKGGSVFYEQVRTLSFEEREAAIESELKEGNMPRLYSILLPSEPDRQMLPVRSVR